MERDLGQPYCPGMNMVGMMGEGPQTTGMKGKFSFRAGGGGPFSLLAGCNGRERHCNELLTNDGSSGCACVHACSCTCVLLKESPRHLHKEAI